MAKKKVNPRKIPVTMELVNKVEQASYCVGFQFSITLALYVLKEKHDAPDEDIIQFFHEIEEEISDIAHGFSNYKDVHDYVRDELGIEVKVHEGLRPKDFRQAKRKDDEF